MTLALMFILDLVAISVMVFGLYFPRHRRKDMVVAFLVVNLGLLSVTSVMNSSGVSLGLGFGLFAVLSIIRLRSSELDHQEVAYYFAALTLGLLGGVAFSPDWAAPALMAVVLLGLFVGDHPRLFARYRVQSMTLDRAWTDEVALVGALEGLLGARVHRIKVRRVDLVEATTTVEVRYELPRSSIGSARVVPGAVDGAG